jgi:hypothetical protein
MLWPQNLKKYDLCWEEGDFFLGGVVVCSLGEESCDGEKKREIGEGRVSRMVIYNSLLPMESATYSFCRWFHRQFSRWIGHVTIWRSRFESLGDSIRKIARKNFHINEQLFFLNSEYVVCNSIGIYLPQYSVIIYRLNYGWNSVRR